MIQLQNVCKSFGNQRILDKINLHVAPEETVVVCGTGGCGKTLLLKLCQGLVKPDSGTIFLEGEDLGQMSEQDIMLYRQKTGTLFQYYALFDSMTVSENIGFYLKNHTNLKADEIKAKVSENLKMVRLEGSEELMPSELSGGMQKRVGIARALVHRPRIMFYDSPTDGLDPVTADAIIDNIISINRDLGVTSLVISNDMNTVFRLADRIALLHDGKIHAIGSPDEIARSDDPYVYQFIRGLGEGPLYAKAT